MIEFVTMVIANLSTAIAGWSTPLINMIHLSSTSRLPSLQLLTNNLQTPATDLLSQLPPIVLPDTISWWPLAAGWWILFTLTVIFLGGIFYLAYAFWKAGRLKRASVAELQVIYNQFLTSSKNKDDNATYHYLQETNQLLRRYCLQYLKQPTLATINGQRWLTLLDQQHSMENHLDSDVGKQLLLLYSINKNDANKNTQAIDIPALNHQITQWFSRAPTRLKKIVNTVPSRLQHHA